MSKQTDYKAEISAAVKKSAGNKTPAKISDIKHSISQKARHLRTFYVRANGSTCKESTDQWLCDNYYIIEKESKQVLTDIKKFMKLPGHSGLEDMYKAAEKVFCEVMPPVDNENTAFFLSKLSQSFAPGENQYAFFTTALKACFITLAWRSCTAPGNEQHISYAIKGFNAIPSLDIDSIICQSSHVEKILLQDPAGIYSLMDSESRSYYRHLISKISAKNKTKETEEAKKALEKSKAAAKLPELHIGYGIVNHPAITNPKRNRGKLTLILQAFLPILAALLAGLWCKNLWLTLVFYLPFWEILRPIISQAALAGADTDFLPKMDIKKIESKPKTVVLISTLLPAAGNATQFIERLEQLYFSNSDPDMYYCILADFKEGSYPTDEQDSSRISATQKVIKQLNQKHNNRFMLFLRSRTYNKMQNKYSGWERKRGAITEFIRFLKGEGTSLHSFLGDRSALPEIKFIIALDADTSLLYESAHSLVATAIHPLNRPVINSDSVVTGGYGILCPKISTGLQSAGTTAFSRIMSGCGGITAYETKDKDFYQDFFGESIFAGKGLIDVDSFYTCLSTRFPDNQILSHDILEGAYLRCGFVSSAEMSDGSPANMTSWLSRLHRWLRGDWQNIIFLSKSYRIRANSEAETTGFSNPINRLSRYKLFDNLRRSVCCVFSLICIVLALFFTGRVLRVLFFAGIMSVCFPSLWAALNTIISGGFFSASRKFFTRTLSHTTELAAQAVMLLVMLPAQSFITIDAVLRSLWRTYVSRKKMLEWTTAAQADAGKISFISLINKYWLPEVFGIAFILFAQNMPLAIIGAVFASVLPVAWLSAAHTPDEQRALSERDKDTLLSYNAAMWRYYEDFADKTNNFLPPDNMQQSPVYRVANRTSPTNIGFLLASALAARDMGFIDNHELYTRIDRTLTTVEKLAKWHGNLYNWYDTVSLETLKPEFVSCVDSGNFICCLVALKEGLREYTCEKLSFDKIIKRIENIIDNCDLAVFYNKSRELFSIGYDVDSAGFVGSHYDFLMSEARLTSYYAAARKIVEKKHWGRLSRTMSRSGFYAGPVSWTGTMFEFFMPNLFLPVYNRSLLGEALTYCIYCQKNRTRAKGIPWGISESAFYAFDNNLNYQYKAHGVQKIGVKQELDRDMVISPYSTFLTIPMNPSSAMSNLRHLWELGVYGRYGFYEAVDFTNERVGQDSLAVIRSYMAHHIGMSMLASCNAMFGGIFQKRFMRDNYMKSAKEFLQEKIAKDAIVYDEIKPSVIPTEKEDNRIKTEYRYIISPTAPVCAILSNGEMTGVFTDTGAGYLKFGSVDLTRRSSDLLRHSQGFWVTAKSGSANLPFTLAPFYDSEAKYKMEHNEQSVTYYAAKKGLEGSVRHIIHPTISCCQAQFTVKNTSSKKERIDILFYFEPVLVANNDYCAHPAYSKLFVTGEYAQETNTLTFKRRNRDSTENMFLTAGFLEDIPFSFETRREELMPSPNGFEALPLHAGKKLANFAHGIPDACCAVSFSISLPPGAKQTANFMLCAARSLSEGIESIISMRNMGALEPRYAAKNPMLTDSLEGRLGTALLGQLLFNAHNSDNMADKLKNHLGQSALWCTGISGDLPILLVEHPHSLDGPVLDGYIKLHSILRAFNIEFDLCVFYDDTEEHERLLQLVDKSNSRLMLGAKGGIYLLLRNSLAEETITLIRAAAKHFAIKKDHSEKNAPALFAPVKLEAVSPAKSNAPAELEVTGGFFSGGRFYVSGKESPLPWCHILANSAFGTLVSDKALGFTWSGNSRENKLTPWHNDICTDNDGEMLILNIGSRCFNIINGSLASFSAESALYEGILPGIKSTVTVTVSPTGCAKYIDVSLENTDSSDVDIKCAYYTEPVLGVTRETAGFICPKQTGENVLLLHNPYNIAKCHAAIKVVSPENTVSFLTDRAAFLSGNWQASDIMPENSPCAAAVAAVTLLSRKTINLRFILACGQSEAAACEMVKIKPKNIPDSKNSFFIKTPDEHLNKFINYFAPHQILASRINGRCAFYQCGGAYGFRDQLQDVCAYLLVEPALAKKQILRCCQVQFLQGDVLHWWHNLPQSSGGIRGVRTKFSDDLLWLPLAVAEYVSKTGDEDILDIKCAYISADILEENEHEKYIVPQKTDCRETVFEHCVKAIERGYNLGENGLPLIGCGDWNDGFSSVGLGGKGTSVWLAMFLAYVLKAFAKTAGVYGDEGYAGLCLERADSLIEAVDKHCWDGSWYTRAFYDNGDKMGSHQSSECSIDLLPQSFAVLADMPNKARVNMGLEHAQNRLVDTENRIVKLFDSAFQYSHQQPGYVKAYPAGIRENGGQYTHSAIWFALALIENGDVNYGWQVLEMLNPVNRASFPKLARQYKLEPYYIAADIYANPHVYGRGGWSMYTGAAAWYYRVVIENLLGLKLNGKNLEIKPKLPDSWAEAGMDAEINDTKLHITIKRGTEKGIFCGKNSVSAIPLDGGEYSICVII